MTGVYRHKVGEPEEVFGPVRQAIAEHGLQAHAIVLITPQNLPKTTSGKIQRSLTKKRFVAGKLEVIARWDAPQHDEDFVDDRADDLLARVRAASGRRKTMLLVDYIQGLAAKLLGLDADDVEPDRPLQELGLDSVTAVEMVERVGQAIHETIPGTLLFDYPSIDDIAGYLLEELIQDTPAEAAEDLDTLSDDDLEAELLRELGE